MTNNTINNVPFELLETLIEQHITAHGFTNHTARQAQLILCAPSPAGVDGLEVAGYVSQDDIKWQGDCTLRIKPYSDYTIPLCRLSDAAAIIDGLRGEVADLRSMLATVSKAGLRGRTERDQQAQRIGELEGLLRDSAELIKHGVFEDGICCCGASVDSHGFGDGHSPVDALAYHAGQVCERIDAALSAGKEGE